MSPPKLVRSAIGVFFEYDTPRIVHIRSKKVGAINRLLQLLIFGYIIGYAIVWQKGYQKFEDVQSAVTTKLKGVVYTNFTNIPGLSGRIWDVADYVIPPQENEAFFVMTNVIVTPEQTQGVCEEDPTIEDAVCDTKPCIPGQPVISGNGVKTGECVNSSVKADTKVCKIYAWCPVERDDNTTKTPTPALAASKNFSVFIKNNIEFPSFGVLRTNIVGFKTDKELTNCRFDPNDPINKLCPIFELTKILELAGVTNYSSIATEGGVIQVTINWNCNLDLDEQKCLPVYGFRRLDRGDLKLSRGFNFRYADHYKVNGTDMRTLYKAYGIRFLINVQGRAGKFNIVPLVLNIGSGLALLAVATVICDIIVLYVLKARTYYRDKKYLDVKGVDAYEVMNETSNGPHQNDDTSTSDS